jgi:DNA-binding GntR family transcriptional regulator
MGFLEGSDTCVRVHLRGRILQRENKSKMVDLTERLVQRRSLHEEIVDILREMAPKGAASLAELDLCRKLNVSRTPMHEAFKLQANRGAVVTGVREEVVERFEELEALRLRSARWSSRG